MLYLSLAIENILSQFKRFLLSVLLVIISLVIIIYIITIYESQGYGYDTCDEMLKGGFEGTGIMTIDHNQTDKDIDGFMNDVCDRDEVAIFGSMECYGKNMEEDIHKIQVEGNDKFFAAKCEEKGDDACFTTAVVMNLSCLKMCDLEIAEGIKPEDLQFEEKNEENYEENITYIYLGSAYSSIPVGTEYSETYSYDNVTYSFVRKVVGIMEEGQRWVDPHIFISVGVEDMDYTVDCTYGVFEITNTWVSNEFCLVPNDNYTLEQAMEATYEVAREYDIELWYTTLQNEYEASCNHTIMILSYFSNILILIMPAMLLMLIAMQIVSVMHELNSFGIMCSVGYSIKEINIMLIIKNVIMAVVSLGIATPIVMEILEDLYEGEVKILANTLLLSTSLPIAIFIMVFVILITSATTVIMLKRYTPVKLMGKRN